MKEKRKIRYYLIHQKMQVRLTLKFILLMLVSSLMTGFVALMSIWPVVSEFVPSPLIQRAQTQMLIKLCVSSIPLLGVMIALGILITHSVAGPLYKIERKLDQVLRGDDDMEDIRIRRHDECQELVTKINRLIQLCKNSKRGL